MGKIANRLAAAIAAAKVARDAADVLHAKFRAAQDRRRFIEGALAASSTHVGGGMSNVTPWRAPWLRELTAIAKQILALQADLNLAVLASRKADIAWQEAEEDSCDLAALRRRDDEAENNMMHDEAMRHG